MFEREACRRAAIHISVLLRPAHPSRCRAVRAAKVAIQRIEPSMQLQWQPAPRDEFQKAAAAFAAHRQVRVAEFLMEQRKNFKFQIRHAAIVDQRLRAQLVQAAREFRIGHARTRGEAVRKFRHGRDGYVQNIEEVSARRTVGTRPRRIRRCQRMQRIHPDKAGAARGHPTNQHFQVAKITDAPIDLRAHRIELHRDSPEPPTGGDRSRLEAFRRGNHQQAMLGRAAGYFRLQLVVAGRQIHGQLEAAARNP